MVGHSAQSCFQDPLRNQVGKAAVWCSGMGVIFDRKPEVARRRLIRQFNDIFAGAEQF